MKNYVFIFHVVKTIEDTEEGNAAWGKWFESLGDSIVDSGNPFNPQAEATIKNGTVTMEGGTAAGYSIIKCNSLDEAIELAKGCPMSGSADAFVTVHETMPM